MKTSSRPRDIGVPFITNRSGHVPQLSLNETKHHVTEAIGDIYGDDKYLKREARILSSNAPPRVEVAESEEPFFDPRTFSWARAPDSENGNTSNYLKSSIMSDSIKRNSSNSLTPHDSAPKTSFTSPDINYETDPADFAQALSDLQALRRMSIDIGSTSDPDLPPFQGATLMPSIAPTGDDNGDDPSRLFWVPARVHPELAPMEFKTFLENRVQSIKRQAGEVTSIPLERTHRERCSGDPLRRRKSMLSRQIDNNSLSTSDLSISPEGKGFLPPVKVKNVDLKELDDLVRNRSEAMRKLTLETNGLEDTSRLEDIPILPQAPSAGLRRSTRTTYRRGSFRREDRANFSKRNGLSRKDEIGSENTSYSPEEKTSPSSDQHITENFSHPIRGARRLKNQPHISNDIILSSRINGEESGDGEESLFIGSGSKALHNPKPMSKAPRRSNTSTQDIRPDPPQRSKTTPQERGSIPQIIETPPLAEQHTSQHVKRQPKLPGRSSSQAQQIVQKTPNASDINAQSSKEIIISNPQTIQSNIIPRQNSTETSSSPASLVGGNSRIDALTFIPTLEVKKSDKKSKKEKDDSEYLVSKKTTWNWFKGGDEREKKEKKKEDEREGKKNKKGSMEKTHDNARLDVLQSTLDSGVANGRESFIIDRDNFDSKCQDEKRKEARKFSSEKKEKESIFSSIFGGGKKKSDRDSQAKKGSSLRTLSPDPLRFLKPDVDYNWTRFSILEERAIYRMAHLKLANPRRALYSQVLLSNFMYSYLAKVQQMHPHLQIPQSALQKKQEMERRQKEQEQQAMQQLQENDQYRYYYHEGVTEHVEGDQQNDYKSDRVNYVDDSQIYNYDHQQDNNSIHGQRSGRPQSRVSQHTGESEYESELQYGELGNEYYQVTDQQMSRDEDEMW